MIIDKHTQYSNWKVRESIQNTVPGKTGCFPSFLNYFSMAQETSLLTKPSLQYIHIKCNTLMSHFCKRTKEL